MAIMKKSAWTKHEFKLDFVKKAWPGFDKFHAYKNIQKIMFFTLIFVVKIMMDLG